MGMTPRQRVLNAFNGKEVDVAPVIPANSIITRELQDKIGYFFPEAHHNAEVMTELALANHTVCGTDAVFPIFGAGTQEAGALGCTIDWGDPDNLPAILDFIWEDPEDIVVPDDYLERLEIKTTLDSIRMLREELGDRVAIIGKTHGPWTLGYHLFGIQNFLMDTFRDPPKVHAILAGLKELQLTYAKAQVEAGIDVLQISNHITADLVRPDAYTTFLNKVDLEIADEISVPIMLHCCGYTLDRVELFNKNGWEGYNFESANDAREMRAKATMCLVGNINNPLSILQGTPEDVEREAFYALNAGVDILAPECAVPVNGKLKNVIAIREARDRYYEISRDEDRDVELINRSTVPVRKSAESSPETAGAGKEGLSASLKEIYDAVLEMKQGEVMPMVEAEIAKGTDVQVILDEALIAAMDEVGNLFAEGIYFVPEMLMAATEMKSGLKVIRPILTETGVPPKGKVLIGTVKGDVHDIGKNLYGMMMEGAGYTVVDIGVRNSADDYIDAMEEHKPDVVGMSAMLTTTMPYMKVVIDEMVARGIRDDYIVLVGGAPLNEEFGKRVGADAYCPEAGTGVETANRLLAERQDSVAASLTGTD